MELFCFVHKDQQLLAKQMSNDILFAVKMLDMSHNYLLERTSFRLFF